MTAPTPPLELRRPANDEKRRSAAIDDAMKAALKGDFGPLDRIELDYLNLLVRIGDLAVRHPDGRLHWWFDQRQRTDAENGRLETRAPFVLRIMRGYTGDAHNALEWALYEKCQRCAGKLRRLPCRVCEGRWYVEDMHDHELVYTDLDGILIEEAQ